MAASIFIIDNDSATIERVQPVLAREGYRVGCARATREGMQQMLLADSDLAIVGIDGDPASWEFCRRVVTFRDKPLLLLLARADERDRVRGLELGADDCMLKPVLMVELVARVRALLRRDVARS